MEHTLPDITAWGFKWIKLCLSDKTSFVDNKKVLKVLACAYCDNQINPHFSWVGWLHLEEVSIRLDLVRYWSVHI